MEHTVKIIERSLGPRTRHPDHSDEKRNTISEINIAFNTHFYISFVNSAPTYVSSI